MLANIATIILTVVAGIIPLFSFRSPWAVQLLASAGLVLYTGLLLYWFPDYAPWTIGVICGGTSWLFGGLGNFILRERNIAALGVAILGLILGAIALLTA